MVGHSSWPCVARLGRWCCRRRQDCPGETHAGLSSKFEHLHEQRGQEFQVLLARNQLMVRKSGRSSPTMAKKARVAFAGLGDLAAGVDADAVESKAASKQSMVGSKLLAVGRVSPVRRIRRRRPGPIGERHPGERKLGRLRGKPVGWAEWPDGHRLRGSRHDTFLATGDDHDESNPGQAGLAQAENTFTRLQLPPADRIGERRIPDSLLGRLRVDCQERGGGIVRKESGYAPRLVR